MSEATIIVRPYAKAVFDLAREAGTIAHWAQMLSLASEIASHPLASEYIRSPLYSKEEKINLFVELFEKSFDETCGRLLRVMASFDRLWVLPALYQAFLSLKKEAANQVDVQLISAAHLDNKVLAHLEKAIAARLGKSIIVTQEIDPSILGGVIVKSGDLVLDGSIRGRLMRLAESIS
jgi:F-type H+-transporting ATPase subunit delta